MIPEDVINEIKRRADLAAVVGRTVKLKKSGRNLVGLCPFHQEKTPSFNVRPDEGFFYCFGCKAAGDVVEFLVRTTGRGFLDVISELAEQTGVEIPKADVDPAEEERQRERKRLLRVLELTQVFFRTRLAADEGKAARAYLNDVRKIDEATVDQFGLGFAGVRDDGLASFLKEQGVSVEDGVAAGVIGNSERGPYDFFRHRITIPIRNARGQVVSFQGRIFGERDQMPDGRKRPKYVNGHNSPVYDKSAVLFGLFEAQQGLRQKMPAVLVEGPLDAIAVARAGVPTAVAPCGTGLTPRHIDEVAAKTERVVVCTDADKAGRDAATRAVLMFLQRGLDVGLVALPDKDPDAMAKEGRLDELRGIVLGAPSALDALIARAREKATGNMGARVQALDELLPFLAAPARELVRAEAARAVARAFNEDPAVIRHEVEQRGRRLLSDRLRGSSTGGARRPAPRSASPARAGAEGGSGDPRAGGAEPRPAARRAPRPSRPLSEPEIMLVEALLTHPHLAARCGVLVPALRNEELKAFIERLIELLVRFHDEDARAVLLDDKRGVPIRPSGQIRGVVLKVQQGGGFARPDDYLAEGAAARIVEDAILTLDKRVLEVRLGELQRLLAEADERDDDGERKRLLEEQAALVEALKALVEPPRRAPLAAAVARALPAPRAANVDEEGPAGQGEAPSGPPDEAGEGAPDEGVIEGEVPYAGDPDDDPWAV